ncbi:MAG TPA: arginase [Fluviicoccus sp.]|nr:arginase [Fluviicoccus sp.]
MKSVMIGAAFAIGGADPGSRAAPIQLARGALRRQLNLGDGGLVWQCPGNPLPWPQSVPELRRSSIRLARRVARMRHRGLPLIIGGDHSCALGTWHGMTGFGQKPLGLLWIDAHLDSHTPFTSPSRHVHGMPLALLLGEGDSRLLLSDLPPVDPRYSVVLGVRSFEAGEPERMHRLGVRYYTMSEIRRRGLRTCWREAVRQVAQCPNGFGLSLDLDALDPAYAPGVSVAEPGGLSLPRLLLLMRNLPRQRLRAIEVVEYNPWRDRDFRTRSALNRLVKRLLKI